jgi:uncharacterized membrane protein
MYGAIRAQWPTALVLLSVNLVLMDLRAPMMARAPAR